MALLNILLLLLLYSLNIEPNSTFAAAAEVSPTPTPNRLAEPTLSPNPRQAELGARDYWLNCMPCHGDQGQGLTDEFRLLYPEEDRNCWKSGCHGARPYENGTTLPTHIPKIIGPGALGHFETAASLYNFIHLAMPYQAPGSLDEQVYWQVTAYLLWKNGLIDLDETLGSGNAAQIYLKQPAVVPMTTALPASSGIQETQVNLGVNSPNQKPTMVEGSYDNLLFILIGLLLAAAAWVLIRFRESPRP